jgi:hypothetical protein
MAPDKLSRLGRNGAAFYQAELSFRRGVDRMVGVFEQAVEAGSVR